MPAGSATGAPGSGERAATILQVGEGRFLRAFLGALADEARRAGRWSSRLVVTAPRPSGGQGLQRLRAAGGRYRIVVRGPAGDAVTEIAPYDAIVDGYARWSDLLDEVRADRPLVIVSNTTEAGLEYHSQDRRGATTYPARLTAWLQARRDARPEGLTAVIPCELIADNGRVLREAVLRHAADWGLDGPALVSGVPFADTLVDRIVTSEDAADPLACFTEPYVAWYIAGMPDWVQEAMPLAPQHVHWVADATPARDRKMRLLNATHTLMAALGLQMGVPTVRAVLAHRDLGALVTAAVRQEGVGSFPAEQRPAAAAFAEETLGRFANPGIEHVLSRIALQMTAKVRARWVPILDGYRRQTGRWPDRFALGIAAYLRLAAAPAAGACDLAEVDDAAWIGQLRALWRPGVEGAAAFVAAACRLPAWPVPREPDLVALLSRHLAAMAGGVEVPVARQP